MDLGFRRQWPMRAGDHLVHINRAEVWSEIAQKLDGAPNRRAFYAGRVDEVDLKGGVHATLYEWPSGRAIFVALDGLLAEELEGPAPAPGDVLHVWTWIELPGGGRRVVRRFVHVLRRALSEEEREELRRIAKELEG